MNSFQAEISEKVGLILSQLNCAICLELYTDPVTLPCGNTFCKHCIHQFRDVIMRNRNQANEDQPQKFSCPSCRVDFGPRVAMPENDHLKELADLARRTVDQWERLFGKPYRAPKVSVPLSQSTDASSDASVMLSSRQSQIDSLENEIPRLSLFGEKELFVTKSSLEEIPQKSDNLQSPPPPLLSPVMPLSTIQPQAEVIGPQKAFVSPPKVYGRSSNPSFSGISKPFEKNKGPGFSFSKPPEKDPYEFKGSQSQDDSNPVPEPVKPGTKRKSTENKTGTSRQSDSANLTEAKSSTDHAMPPPKGKTKRATKSNGNTTAKSKEPAIDPLSSQNPVIQRMRSIIQAAEEVELAVEDEPVAKKEPLHRDRSSAPQKRVIENECGDVSESGGKKLKKAEPTRASAPQEKTSQFRKVFGPEADSIFDPSPENKNTSTERPCSGEVALVAQISLSQNDENKPPISNIVPVDPIEPPKKKLSTVSSSASLSLASTSSPVVVENVTVETVQPVQVPVERKEMKHAATETPTVSGYILIFPDGRTAMAAVTKHLSDASVQTDDLPQVSIENVPMKQFCAVETQTDVTRTGVVEVQTEDIKVTTPEPTGLPTSVPVVACDESTTFWSIPQDDRPVVSSQAAKSSTTSLQPSASSLCPESLAVVAALCISDEDGDEDMADTVVANSNYEIDFVGSTPPAGDEVVLASQSASNQPQPDSVEVVPSSVQSFLRSQDPTGVTNMQLSVLEDKSSPGRTVMNLTRITPATELVMPKMNDEDDNRTSLNNFINRVSAQMQSSTPSGATLRKFTFTTQEPAPSHSPPQPPPQPQALPLTTATIIPSSVLPPSQTDLPQLLREARITSATMSLTSSGCTQCEPYFNALKAFCELFSCRQTNSFIIKSTTHVVLKTVPDGNDNHRICDRTMKFLMAMAARRWVVSIQWVIDSVREKRVMSEEEYEITGDTSTAPDHYGPSKSRSSRVGLLDNMEICIPEDSFINQTFTRADVFQLIELCGGTRIDSPDAFSYRRGTKRIIAMEEPVSETGSCVQPSAEEMKRRKDMHRRYKAVILSVDWVLDSISRCARIDASLAVNAAYRLFPCAQSELAALASN